MSQTHMLDPTAVWAMDPTVLEALVATPSALFGEVSQSRGKPYMVEGGVAIIDVSGMLVPGSTKLSFLSISATGYDWIAGAVRAAAADESAASIRLVFNSPGGIVCGGLPAAVEAIEGVRKPVTSYISGACCSAAMPLAFAAGRGRVIASPMASGIGCLGVMATMRKLESDTMRIVEHRFVSEHTPRKNAPLDSPEGAEDTQARIDEHGETFLAMVGRLRGVGEDPATVAKRYGEGRTVAPREALAMGLIDSIQIGQGAGHSTSSGIAASEDTMTDKTQVDAAQVLATAKALDEMTVRASTAEADAGKWKDAADAAVARAEAAEAAKADAEARAAELEQKLADERNARLESEANAEFDRLHAAGDFTNADREGYVKAHVNAANGDDTLMKYGFAPRIGAGSAGGIGGEPKAQTHGRKAEPEAALSTDERVRKICKEHGRKPSQVLRAIEDHRAEHHVDEATALDAIEAQLAG